jgi:hypothetical protein
MAAESGADVHYSASRCLLGFFDAAAEGLADWSEFERQRRDREQVLGQVGNQPLVRLLVAGVKLADTSSRAPCILAPCTPRLARGEDSRDRRP